MNPWLFVAVYAGARLLEAGVRGESVITTVAGGAVGDGRPATDAWLYNPNGMSAWYNTSSGGVVLYIADGSNHRIRRVNEGGVISSVAGSDSQGFSGDGGPATAAQLNSPFGVALLSNASTGGVVLYVSDRNNQRVRRVSEGGIITTVAGNGTYGFSGDGGPAAAAMLRNPSGVAALVNAASGGVVLYIADQANNRVRRVGEDGIITTVAGTGASSYGGDGGPATLASLKYPTGVSALIDAGSGGVVLYIADIFNFRIRRVNEAGVISSVAGTSTRGYGGDGGAATAALLYNPSGVTAVANASSGGVVLYIADWGNNRVRRVSEDGIITTVAGTGTAGFSGDGGPATVAKLNSPYNVVAVTNTSSGGVVLYVADVGNLCVRRVDGNGIIATVAGTGVKGDGSTATSAILRFPSGVSALYNASSGGVVLYIADTNNHRIRRVNESGIITTVAGNGTMGFSGDGGPATAAMLYSPRDVSVVMNTASGGAVLYIVDGGNFRVRCVNEGGIITTVAGSDSQGFDGDGGPATAASLNNPSGVAAVVNASSGGVILFIADSSNQRIRRVGEDGIISSVAGTDSQGFDGDGIAATAASLNSPSDVSAVFNASSGGVVLFIADTNNNRIRRVGEDGIVTTVAGTDPEGFSGDGGPATLAMLRYPYGVSAVMNTSSGGVVLYITDMGNQRVRRVSEDGIITTVAGTGMEGFSGDGGIATVARLRNPQDAAAVMNAASGSVEVYIADSSNERIRRIADEPSPSPSPTASSTATRSSTPTRSGTGTPSSSVSATRSPSGTVTSSSSGSSSSSSTPSGTGAPTSSTSATRSPSGTSSSSTSNTPTPFGTGTPTSSVSTSRSPGATGSSSALPTPAGTSTSSSGIASSTPSSSDMSSSSPLPAATFHANSDVASEVLLWAVLLDA